MLYYLQLQWHYISKLQCTLILITISAQITKMSRLKQIELTFYNDMLNLAVEYNILLGNIDVSLFRLQTVNTLKEWKEEETYITYNGHNIVEILV